MLRYLTLGVTVWISTLLVPCAIARTSIKLTAGDSLKTEIGITQGTFLMEEDAWVEYTDQQVHVEYFQSAHIFLAKGDTKKTAKELRKGALYMQMEGGRATKESEPMLRRSEGELRGLSENLLEGNTIPTQRLDSAFALANYVLASHHLQKARDAWADKDVDNTGHDLKTAANQLILSIGWNGATISDATRTISYDVAALAEKMIGGDDVVGKDVESEIDALGKQIDAAAVKLAAR